MSDAIASIPISAETRRAEIRAQAAAIGIDEPFISRLVDAFYARVRAQPQIGPIFERVIGDDWDRHLGRMKAFWASVALNAGVYSGKPAPVHMKLTDVQPAHFAVWLALFRETLTDIAPTPAAVDYMMVRADRIAESLQLAMFGFPGLPVKRP